MKNEFIVKPSSGYLMIALFLLLFGLGFILLIGFNMIGLGLALVLLPCLVILPGFLLVNPNDSKVLLLFGEYKGTVKTNGFFWVNPFMGKKRRDQG